MSKQSELNAAYRAVRQNYLRNIRSMERRGYVFERDMRPSIPKRITEGSIRKLERLNKSRYNNAYLIDTGTGEVLGKGAQAQRIERSRASRQAWENRRAAEANTNIDQMVAALRYETQENATPGGTTETFFNEIVNSLERIADKASKDNHYALWLSDYLDRKWSDIQRAIEYIGHYGRIEAAPDQLVDWLIIRTREMEGRTVTQEDMRLAGTLSESPDYYPVE